MPRVDRDSTADFIVNMLAENGIESEEIKEYFGTDTDIKNALLSYFGDEDLGDWEEEEFDDYEDEGDDDY
jgi:hypothetical protein